MSEDFDLFEKLITLSESNVYPFHMPGHKRQNVREAVLDAADEVSAESEQKEEKAAGRNLTSKKNTAGINSDNEKWFPEKFDITEIDGFDNLHHTTGVLKEINMHLAALYGIKNARMLVGGSTTGILSAVFATIRPGDIILLARNCHMSVYHAALLSHAKVKFLYPEGSGIVTAESVKRAFEEDPDIKEVIITDPTYEGMKSDIKAISEIAHENKALLLVDAAHGAHLIRNITTGNQKVIFPNHPINDGADIAISSLHKTLPALTGTAEILFSDALPKEIIKKTDDAIDIFETSSPSYILMASISNCVEFLEKKGKIAYEKYVNRLKKFYKETAKFEFPKVLSPENRDPSKIVIMVGNGVSGYEIMDILRQKYHLELEEASENYCLAMTSIMDTEEGFRRLKTALAELNKRFKKKKVAENTEMLPDFKVLDGVEQASDLEENDKDSEQAGYCKNSRSIDNLYDFSKYYFSVRAKVSDDGSIGKMAAGFVEIYPPGVPFIFPGLKLTEDMVKYIEAAKKSGAEIIGQIDDEA